MLCPRGETLLAAYRQAALSRSAARDTALLAGNKRTFSDTDDLSTSRQRYSDTFIAWVTHRGDCLLCRSQPIQQDREQFRSM